MAKRKAHKKEAPFEGDNRNRHQMLHLVMMCFFFISGMTGLIYEILWTRMIVVIIGNAPFAISIVLTVFMGGLGLGSFLAGRYVSRLKTTGDLLKAYGILELIVGAYGLMLPGLLVLFKPLYAAFYNSLFRHFLVYNLVTFLCCSLLLILPVTCMGATLPVLSRFFVTRLSRIGASLGRLYSMNTIGGALGSLLCGFWIVSIWGVWGSLVFAVLLNAFIGLSSIYLGSRNEPGGGSILKNNAPPDIGRQERDRVEGIAALCVFAVSGFCSMAYEVIWTKLMGLIIGPTIYSFTIVLVSFIMGLAVGSAFFGWLADRTGKPAFLLVSTQITAALSALFISHLLGNSQIFYAKLIFAFSDNFTMLMMVKSLVLFSSLLLPTLFLGAAFPLVGKLYTRTLEGVGRSIGFVYSVNTLGAVLGSFTAGFILIPLLGKESSLRLLAMVQLAAAVAAGSSVSINARKKAEALIPLMIAVLIGILSAAYFPRWDRKMLSEGIYYHSDPKMLRSVGWMEALVKRDLKVVPVDAGRLVYYSDGLGGFTTVRKFIGIDGKEDYFAYSSGKVDASTLKIDMVTQTLLAHFPLLFHSHPEKVLVLGLASGITAGETLHYPIKELDVLEINQQMVVASGFFRPWNNNVVSDPRTRIIIQDARAHMQLTRRTYDVIISEPSNPWMAGLANLFTREYFELNRDRLNENGIFIQWVHSYQMDWRAFSLIGRTFQTVFPGGKLIRTSDSALDLMLVGFKGDGILDGNVAERNIRYAMKSHNMTLTNPYVFYDLILSEDLGKLFGRGPFNTDNRPLLEYSAPKIIYRHKDFSSAGYQEIIGQLKKNRWMRPETNDIIQAVNADFEAQMDRIQFYLPGAIPIDLSGAAPEQISRYAGILASYCSNNLVENFSFVDDADLLRMCIATQIQTMEKKIGVVENQYGLFSHLANLYYLSNMPRDAINYYIRAIRADSTQDKACFNLGKIYSEQGFPDMAIEMYRKAAHINPRVAEVFFNMGLVFARQKKLAEAEENLRHSLSLDPELSPAHFLLGNVLKEMGKTAEGNQHIEEAARLEKEIK